MVQTTMLAYKLTGGSISRGVPGDRGNMFNYSAARVDRKGCSSKGTC